MDAHLGRNAARRLPEWMRWEVPRRRVLGVAGGAGVLAALASAVAHLRRWPRVVRPVVEDGPLRDAAVSAVPAPTAVGGPRRCDEMPDMIGVVLHLTGAPTEGVPERRNDYLYSQFRDRGPAGGAGWLALMAGAGIRHVRCDTGGSIAPGTAPNQEYALETLRLLDHAKPSYSPPFVTGIDKTFLSGAGVATDVPVLRRAGGRMWMIEGPNESWPPNGKFLPSFVNAGGHVFMCIHSVACADALPPVLDRGRWLRCRARGRFDRTFAYQPLDIVTADGRTWVAPPGYAPSAASAPPTGWWDVSSPDVLDEFSTGRPGIYRGYNQAGELGVAWGEFIARGIADDNIGALGYWSRSGRGGGPTRIATWSEAGMDIYQYWNPGNDASLVSRYATSMPGGSTNVHLYASGQPSDPAATCSSAIGHADRVLPGYPIYLGEIGQATYPTDDELALGTGAGSTPSATVTVGGTTFPVDQRGRPMPGSTTGRFGAEHAQAQMITRSWAEMFRSAQPGSRLAVYELLNEPFSGYRDYAGEAGYPASGGPHMDYNRSEGNFGLLRNDLTPKPAFVAIANVCRLMGDGGDQHFAPRPVDVDVVRTVVDRPSAQAELGAFDELHWVVTQGSDGVFRVPIWYVNVRATGELLPGMGMGAMAATPPTERVRLRVRGATPHRIEAYNVQVSATRPQASVTDSAEIEWLHTADVWIIRIIQTH